MGACQSLSRAKATIKANAKDNNNTDIKSDLTSKISQTSYNSKNQTTRSNLNYSSNSTKAQIFPSNNSYTFGLPATLGEIEIPILVERNEKIMIKINNEENNEKNLWSFLINEKPVNYLGHQNYKYNDINIGALLLRITGDNKIYYLDKAENIITANDRGNLLFFANLNINDYSVYEPKGSLSITIFGGNYAADKELFFSININCFSNKNKIDLEDDKESQILDYINKARNNLNKFYHLYFTNIEQKNLEFKKYMFNYKKRKELIICKELNTLAKNHCEYLCENETSGFARTDEDEINNKTKNYYDNFFGISTIYNINNPLLIVKNLMIDKYSKKKKNRENLFYEKYKKIGIYLKEHPIYKYCCVLVFSDK
jgi:hypothetical protein